MRDQQSKLLKATSSVAAAFAATNMPKYAMPDYVTSVLDSMRDQQSELLKTTSSVATAFAATNMQKYAMFPPIASVLDSIREQEQDMHFSWVDAFTSAVSIQKDIIHSSVASALESIKEQEQNMQRQSMELFQTFTCVQQNLQRISDFYPVALAEPPAVDSVLSAFDYLWEENPALYQQVNDILTADIADINNEAVNDNLDAYIAICEEIVANITCLYSAISGPDAIKGLACLAIYNGPKDSDQY